MGNGDQGIRRFERRWAPRFRYHADLEIEWGSTVLRARTRDLSSNGMFIESVDPLWVGAGFTAQLTLDPPLRVNCFVKRVEPGRGMGVSVALAEEDVDHHLFAVQDAHRALLYAPTSERPIAQPRSPAVR